MPAVGLVCPFDGSFQEFDTCIACHENFGPRLCHAPVELLINMKGNQDTRKNAGWSASTLLSCPRAVALMEKYDYYEPLHSGYNKTRGSWMHAMFENEKTSGLHDEGDIIIEKRIEKSLMVLGKRVRITGKPDKIYVKQKVIIDYKSKYRLPTKLDESHEAQMNIYVWLCDGGYILHEDEDGNITLKERIDLKIEKGGMHYITWNTKAGEQFRKVAYPIWEPEVTQEFVRARLSPLVQYQEDGVLPTCDPFIKGRWDCDCVKHTKQLEQRGIVVE